MRLKFAIGTLLAVAMCFSALGVSSASATTLFESGVAIPKSTPVNLTSTGEGSSTLAVTFAGIELEIECALQEGMAVAENVEVSATVMHISSKGTNTYSNCTVQKPVGGVCTVEQPITTSELTRTTLEAPDGMKDEYKPVSGPFVTLNLTGASCPVALKGNKSVTGTAVAEGNETTGVESFTATSGSSLKVIGQAATFFSRIKYETTGTTTQVISKTP